MSNSLKKYLKTDILLLFQEQEGLLSDAERHQNQNHRYHKRETAHPQRPRGADRLLPKHRHKDFGAVHRKPEKGNPHRYVRQAEPDIRSQGDREI